MDKQQRKHPPEVHLDRVRAGAIVEIVELAGDPEQVRSLEQLGIRQSERGRVASKAPLGGPVLLEIGGSSVAVARNGAKQIKVKIV